VEFPSYLRWKKERKSFWARCSLSIHHSSFIKTASYLLVACFLSFKIPRRSFEMMAKVLTKKNKKKMLC